MDDHDFWTDRLSEALDGTLPTEEAGRLTEHLAGCPACRRVRDELEAVRRRGRSLTRRAPEADLWARIAPRLEGPEPARGDVRGKVIPIHTARIEEDSVDDEPRRGLRMAPLQAAAAALVLLAGGAALGSLSDRSVPELSTPSVVEGLTDARLTSLATGAGEPALFGELQVLDEALRADLSRLDPDTRGVILRNLDIIDRAIRESIAALEADPESRYLQGHLGDALRRKVGYLQNVTRLLES
ncbi:MAG: zf-HC2 domain-containing protein [Gemmatimonadota bacterium]